MKEEIGDRMKEYYENRTRILLPRRTYTLIRIDGKSFHTYTKGLNRPFDDGLIDDMDTTAAYLCQNIMGAKFAYVQSDEISILLTDFEELTAEAWFDNNLQKACSVSASMATAKFNECRIKRQLLKEPHLIENLENFAFHLAEFDSRVFQIAQKAEVENYFIWRQQDATRNSIITVAHTLYGHSPILGKSVAEMQELIFQKGMNWNDFAPKYKRGRVILKETYEKQPDSKHPQAKPAIRTRWVSVEPPIFTKERTFLEKLIP